MAHEDALEEITIGVGRAWLHEDAFKGEELLGGIGNGECDIHLRSVSSCSREFLEPRENDALVVCPWRLAIVDARVGEPVIDKIPTNHAAGLEPLPLSRGPVQVEVLGAAQQCGIRMKAHGARQKELVGDGVLVGKSIRTDVDSKKRGSLCGERLRRTPEH